MRILFEARRALMESNHGGNNPYHNNRHILAMTEIAGMLYMGTAKEQFKIEEYINLYIACIFHDFNHSGGEVSDFLNIRSAVIMFLQFIDQCVVNKTPGIEYVNTDVVENIIRCTEYPFGRAPDNLLEKCARDADILYATLSMDPTIIMESLRKELIVFSKTYIDYGQMLSGQEKFLKEAVMYTELGDELMNTNRDLYFDLLKKYVESKVNVIY